MRFGKKKVRPVALRREISQVGDELVETPGDGTGSGRETPEDAGPQGSAISGDPTQRLLTSLGRFHRYVAKGQAGAPQQFWCDDCMNQLVAAVELSLAQSWSNIVEALTGTARILQSYENANAAHLCIPFLNDSYEILCLMVGDVIVNNERSGVTDKWRERYEQAVAELTNAGFTLVADEGMEEPEPSLAKETAVDGPDRPVLEQHGPAVSAPETAAGTEPQETYLPFGEQENPPPPAAALEETPDPQVVSALDLLCEELGRLNQADNYVAVFHDVAERVDVLDRLAQSEGLQVPARLCRRMMEIIDEAAALARPADDRFFDAAYAFCEAYMDARRDPDGELGRSWLAESHSVLATLRAERQQAVKTEPETPLPSGDKAEELLEIAKRAIVTGDMAGAKVLALQAVAKLAQSETGKAEARVREAERHFQKNAEDIEHARAQVKKAEQEVALAEQRLAEAGAKAADTRALTTVIEERVQVIEKKVVEIEDQIRALEAIRDKERARVRETQAELSQVRNELQHAEASMESLRELETASRATLENARQHVKDLQHRRLELEEALSRARETLTHHKSSLTDIERTIDQFRPAQKPPEPDQEGLLF